MFVAGLVSHQFWEVGIFFVPSPLFLVTRLLRKHPDERKRVSVLTTTNLQQVESLLNCLLFGL